MEQRSEPWVVVATYGAIWEAEFAAETLMEAGIPAHVDRGPGMAIFGPGFQGHSQFGVRLRVPWHREADARDLLGAGMDDDDDPHSPSDPAPETP